MVLEKTFESPLDCKEIKTINLKGNQSWIFIGRTDAEAETPILWLPGVKNPLLCWERWKARGERDDRGQDGWMAPPTQWTWGWESARRWWWTGKPGMLQSIGPQRVRHDRMTEKQQQRETKRPLEKKLGNRFALKEILKEVLQFFRLGRNKDLKNLYKP